MIISVKNNFIFIHVYKTGGTSIQKLLTFLDAGQVDRFGDLPLHYHAKACDIRDLLGAELFSRMFSFAFVRNPWDFIYSNYKYGIRKKELKLHHEFMKFRDFEHYLRFRYYTYLEALEKGDLAASLDTQTSFVCDRDGSRLVDFVGRFENIDADVATVLERIGFDPNLKLPHENRSTLQDFRSAYKPRMVDWVARIHERDIAYFGYTFEA